MKVSIAMATYNGARYLSDQLDSIAQQTRPPDELVVSDDRSTDETVEILKAFSRSAPFEVRIIQNDQNVGYTSNFNLALQATTGDLVFLSDQDDVWLPSKLALIEGRAKQDEDGLLFVNDAALTDGELNSVGLTKLAQIRSVGLDDTAFVMGCCCAVRRELLALCMPIPRTFKGHDDWLSAFAHYLGGRRIETTVLQLYRRHGGNESGLIANQTTKARKWHVYRRAVKSLLTGKVANTTKFELRQKTLLLDGVRRAIENGSEGRRDRLERFAKEVESGISKLESRIAIQGQRTLKRACSVAALAFEGGYKRPDGLRGMFIDLSGNRFLLQE